MDPRLLSLFRLLQQDPLKRGVQSVAGNPMGSLRGGLGNAAKLAGGLYTGSMASEAGHALAEQLPWNPQEGNRAEVRTPLSGIMDAIGFPSVYGPADKMGVPPMPPQGGSPQAEAAELPFSSGPSRSFLPGANQSTPASGAGPQTNPLGPGSPMTMGPAEGGTVPPPMASPWAPGSPASRPTAAGAGAPYQSPGPGARTSSIYGLRERSPGQYEGLSDWAKRVGSMAPGPPGMSDNSFDNPMAGSLSAQYYQTNVARHLPWQALLKVMAGGSQNPASDIEQEVSQGPSTMTPENMQAISTLLDRYGSGDTAGMGAEQQSMAKNLIDDPYSQAAMLASYIKQRTGGFGAEDMTNSMYDLVRSEFNDPLGPQAQAQSGPFMKRALARLGGG